MMNSRLFRCDGRLRWQTLTAMGALPIVMYACALPPLAEPSVKPQAINVEQVRDPLTGRLYYTACNPCKMPTVKTLDPPAAPTPASVSSVKPVLEVATQTATATTLPAQSTIAPYPEEEIRVAQTTGQAEPTATQLKTDFEFESVKRMVPFSFARAGVGPQARRAMIELVSMAKKSEKIWVRGRTDSVGSTESNRLIAKARAATVREEFISAGVPKSRIATTYCIDCFITSNDTEAGRRANRRVDVELLMPRAIARNLPLPVYAKAEIDAPVLTSALNIKTWHEKSESN